MRAKKPNENVVDNRNITEFFDELGRNTYYFNKKTHSWVEKQWIRLSNGADKEIFVKTSGGYYRQHYYDIYKCLLVKEIDSHGNKNLLAKRQQWNPKDNEISQEILKPQSKKLSTQLF